MDEQLTLDLIAKAVGADPTPEAFTDALAVLTAFKEKRPIEESAYARWFRERAADAVAVADDADAERLASIVEDIALLNADFDFDSYCIYMEWGREPAKRFYQPRRHVLFPKVVVHLQDLLEGQLDFLSISMPPRTAKSTTCIFFLTMVMGMHPERANIMSGHSDKLTEGFHKEALSIITDGETYRFAKVFPYAPFIESSMKNETIALKRVSRFPTLTCRSIEGTLTGAVEVGKDALLYMDDLVEDREEALNADRMDKLYSAYLNQLKDRMNDGAKQLFVATRWCPNDPIGRIEEQYADNPRYRFVAVPALDENGESNFVYKYGLGFSTGYYVDMRESLTANGEADSWAAKYMGQPYWMTGLMFAADELKYYTDLPDGEPDAVLAVCDTKDRGADYASMPVVAVYGQRHYLIDAVCDNSLPEIVEPRLAECLVRNHVDRVRFESNAAGGRVADSVGEKCAELGHYVDVSKKYSTENKETRILVDSGWVKENVYFPSECESPDMRRFMGMLTHYTVSGKNKHDDAPDSMSMYKRFAQSMRKAVCAAVKRPW